MYKNGKLTFIRTSLKAYFHFVKNVTNIPGLWASQPPPSRFKYSDIQVVIRISNRYTGSEDEGYHSIKGVIRCNKFYSINIETFPFDILHKYFEQFNGNR